MSYRIEMDKRYDTSSGYFYRIYENDHFVARFWHDSRQDDHGFEFPDGTTDDGPLARVDQLLKGGGRHPITLSERIIAYLESRKTSK